MTAEPPPRLAERLARLASARPGERIVAALAGPPGAGKSTLAAATADRLNASAPGSCIVVPMDGFHYDDAVLEARGLRPRKGAPETFDVDGLEALIRRLRARDRAEVAAPLFDRALEISRAGALIVPRAVPIVLVEGNWLLLDRPAWSALRPLFDLAALLTANEGTLARRLAARWADLPPAAAMAKIEANDLPNARLVLSASAPPDLLIDGDAAL